MILSCIKGYKIPFITKPRRFRPIQERDFYNTERKNVNKLIADLKEKGAIVECETDTDQFLSKIFVIPKRDGTFVLF